jgi:hypothetical protein
MCFVQGQIVIVTESPAKNYSLVFTVCHYQRCFGDKQKCRLCLLHDAGQCPKRKWSCGWSTCSRSPERTDSVQFHVAVDTGNRCTRGSCSTVVGAVAFIFSKNFHGCYYGGVVVCVVFLGAHWASNLGDLLCHNFFAHPKTSLPKWFLGGRAKK